MNIQTHRRSNMRLRLCSANASQLVFGCSPHYPKSGFECARTYTQTHTHPCAPKTFVRVRRARSRCAHVCVTPSRSVVRFGSMLWCAGESVRACDDTLVGGRARVGWLFSRDVCARARASICLHSCSRQCLSNADNPHGGVKARRTHTHT